ncbi:STAS domain-containing protein [Actinophytocola sp.]|uniref:STAS domain-containing protein n=1 Tax=Actinophytocola sp. TaxID=1872138 RepID=UPI0025BDA05E|nr:STAS domain-containing protein [Actinophytocola sp.]
MPRDPGDSRTPPVQVFDIDVELRSDHTVVAHVFGAVDLLTAPELQVCVDDHVDAANGLVLDLSRVDFLAASGLTVLTDTDRRAAEDNFAWALVANTRPVLRPLEVLGLRDQLPTYDSVPGAVAAVSAVTA